MNFDTQRAALGNLEKKQKKFDTVSDRLSLWDVEYHGMDCLCVCRLLLRNAAKLSNLQLKGMQLKTEQGRQRPKYCLCHANWKNCKLSLKNLKEAAEMYRENSMQYWNPRMMQGRVYVPCPH